MGQHHEILRELREPTRSLGRAIPDTWERFMALHSAAMSDGEVPRRLKEATALAISVVKRCDGCIAYHARARGEGGGDAGRGRRAARGGVVDGRGHRFGVRPTGVGSVHRIPVRDRARSGGQLMAAIAWLAEIGRGDAPVVGGKAANLGELMRIGLPVPAGFVVTVEAYLHAMEDGGVRDELRALARRGADEVDDPVAFGASAERMRALVRKAGMPARLRDEVLDAYHRLGDGVAVAVRSSAHGEDTLDASFAGMYDTYLNVVGDEELLDRVIDCWVSLYGERVIAYRRALTLDAEPAMAVVVQVLVDADRAGVMFTADPSTREEDSLIIEAGFGLGEVLNGGEVEPDTYMVSKRTMRVRQVRVGYKSHKAVPREDRRASPGSISGSVSPAAGY